MKPLGFQLEEMRDLLAILDPLPGSPQIDDPAARLAQFSDTAEQACEQLRAKLRIAEEFAAMLRTHLNAAGHDRDRSAAAGSSRT